MDGAATLDLLIRDSNNKQLNSNNKEASGQSPLSLFAVLVGENKTANMRDMKTYKALTTEKDPLLTPFLLISVISGPFF